MRFPFPKDFLFGAASSAVQIESGCTEGGKGEDIHDRNYKLDPESYKFADFNESADFYHRYPEDIQMMKELGLKLFRFSISWSRIYPNGPEQVNRAGLDYYSDMIDKLLAADIVPFFDLWHCDLPQWVADREGLLNPQFIDWFTAYAKTVFEALGDKVPYWSTVNEPNINCVAQYGTDRVKINQACHTMIIAHYRAVRLFRQMGLKGKIGAVVHVMPFYALDPGKAEDVAAAERCQANYSGWWLDPMLKGYYPKEIIDYPFLQKTMPTGFQKQMEEEFLPMDFIGVNYYNPGFAVFEANDEMEFKKTSNPDLKKDDYGFATYPDGLFDTVMFLKNTYPGKDIFITENGIGVKKWGKLDEEQHDDYRIKHMREHLRSLSRALQAGAPVKGYCHWSIMDTNELRSAGYDLIFGLVQVNYETKERRPRDSWYYYQQIIHDGFVD